VSKSAAIVDTIVDVETIRVVLDKKLLEATDKVARRLKRNRSALVREALREYLRRVETLTLEERDREGYRKHPQTASEWACWEAEAAWPEK
jgi:metal-responsive CopG/Arc/MetJ family transcriptional regulator